MQARCMSCCTVSIHSRSKNEQSTSMQTTKKAQNAALECPKMVQHSDVLPLCRDGLKALGLFPSSTVPTVLIPTVGLLHQHKGGTMFLWLDGEDMS